MYALNLSNPALGLSLWPICKPFQITVFFPTQNLCPTHKKGKTERSISASKLYGLSERDYNGSRRTCLTCREGHGTIRNDSLCPPRQHLTSRPARPTKGLPLKSSTAFASTRMYTVWFGCNFLVQHDNQSAPRNVLGGYWVHSEAAIRVLCMRARNSKSSNRVRTQIHCASSPRVGHPHRTSN